MCAAGGLEAGRSLVVVACRLNFAPSLFCVMESTFGIVLTGVQSFSKAIPQQYSQSELLSAGIQPTSAVISPPTGLSTSDRHFSHWSHLGSDFGRSFRGHGFNIYHRRLSAD